MNWLNIFKLFIKGGDESGLIFLLETMQLHFDIGYEYARIMESLVDLGYISAFRQHIYSRFRIRSIGDISKLNMKELNDFSHFLNNYEYSEVLQ